MSERGSTLLITAVIGGALGAASLTLTSIAHNAARAHAVRHASLCAHYAALSMLELAQPGAPARGGTQTFSLTLGRDRVHGVVALPADQRCRLVAAAECRGAAARAYRPVAAEGWCTPTVPFA